ELRGVGDPLPRTLDGFAAEASKPGTMQYLFANETITGLKHKPSEYVKNCYFGSFFSDDDINARHQVGVNRLMWAADFPHHEGTWPWTRKALRANFAGVPENEVRHIVSLNAAECYGFDLDQLQPI